MKKVFAWILLATMATTILVGCAPKEEAAAPEGGAATGAADGQAGGAKTPADDATAGQ